MNPFKLAIVGAGSSYTPELIEGLLAERQALPVSEIIFMDPDEERLEILTGFCRRFMQKRGVEIPITPTTNRREAVSEARFIVTQIRVGGNRQRILDEQIPLRHGLVGQETTGAGGMFKALRTIPVLLELAREVETVNPQAWIVNYTNPTGLVTEAVLSQTRARMVGLCSGVLFPAWQAAAALSVPASEIQYDYLGLNHLSFASNFSLAGRSLNEAEFDRVLQAAGRGGVDYGVVKALRLVPSPYLQYYYHTHRKIAEVRAKGKTRGEEVLELEREVFTAYGDPTVCDKPEALRKRGGGGYSQVALALMKALNSPEPQTILLNTLNRGAIADLPEEAVVEIPVRVSLDTVQPQACGHLPEPVRGLVQAVKNYETLAVQAAVTGSRELALLALLAHPLVREADLAQPLLEEMLAANRAYLPQFFT